MEEVCDIGICRWARSEERSDAVRIVSDERRRPAANADVPGGLHEDGALPRRDIAADAQGIDGAAAPSRAPSSCNADPFHYSDRLLGAGSLLLPLASERQTIRTREQCADRRHEPLRRFRLQDIAVGTRNPRRRGHGLAAVH